MKNCELVELLAQIRALAGEYASCYVFTAIIDGKLVTSHGGHENNFTTRYGIAQRIANDYDRMDEEDSSHTTEIDPNNEDV